MQSDHYVTQAIGAIERSRFGLSDELLAIAVANAITERERRELRTAWQRKTPAGKVAALRRYLAPDCVKGARQ